MILFALYMLPTLVGVLRARRSAFFMAFINLVTGWTGFGWICCLLWAMGNDHAPTALDKRRKSRIHLRLRSWQSAFAYLFAGPRQH